RGEAADRLKSLETARNTRRAQQTISSPPASQVELEGLLDAGARRRIACPRFYCSADVAHPETRLVRGGFPVNSAKVFRLSFPAALALAVFAQGCGPTDLQMQ